MRQQTLLCVGRHVAKPDRGETGAGEVERRDVGFAVRHAPGVVVVALRGQHGHPAPSHKSYDHVEGFQRHVYWSCLYFF